ncbi:CHASE2 domain-containing serine/threonine-protein kinase [Iningainema tapete]|uniref:non-specific serine/threonine protein kinase n=1 Tax=Iningainema tapete BLCC-T55 TaxID=2748662 RepID=A0A8J6XLJ9_9CYAN|nr:CHASE2 domain-containing serine/threonine-protein kinase [Iningainema tapete]MBD2772672.1 CHASE2 domain-containing protein [Iningainema tapete BLCC-T55]
MSKSWKNLLTQPTVIASVITSVLLVGVQRLGVLEPIELKAFDSMMQNRPQLEPDPRLLIVGFSENDIQKLKQSSPNGDVLDTVLSKLERYQPKVIGVDFFRDIPVEPGHQKLLNRIQQSSNIVPICRVGGDKIPAVPAPASIKSEYAGFVDIPEDPDGVIRRNLLVVSPDPKSSCATPASFGFQLAIQYLKIQPEFPADDILQLGKTTFKRLETDSGGYQNIDANGFQILLNYRSANNVAQQVSLTDVLSDRFKPSWVKNRIVLIGSTAPSSQDIRNTPYTSGLQNNSGKMPGVIIHAHMVSQILDAVSEKRPLFWFVPQWGELLWTWGWSLVGGILAWRFQHPLRLVLFGGVALGILLLSNFAIFIIGGWIPIAPPALGFVVALVSIVVYTAFENKQQKEKIANQVQEQKETISLLQALLKEGGSDITELPLVNNDGSIPDKLLNKRYRISDLLGSGGFSYTYLAEDTYRPGRPLCVVKHLQPARQDDFFLDIARRLFRTEAEILELLGEHEQIPQLMAYFEENQKFYLVQEYIQGHSLQVELAAGKRWEDTKVIDFLKDVLRVLMFVHSYRVIHRDLKPSNLIRRQTDQKIVLIDFGAVKQIQPQQQQEDFTVAVGTAGYSPGEQLMGQPRLNSDIYALGMIAIQALTGVSPKQLERDKTTALVWRHLAKVRLELAAVIDKMVAFDFQKRYQTAEEVLHSLEILSGERRQEIRDRIRPS